MKVRIAISVSTIILLSLNIIWAAQAVQVVQDLGEINASFSCQHQANGNLLSLGIPALALRDVNLDSRAFKNLELPTSQYLVAGGISEDGKPDIPVLTTLIAIPDQAGVRLTVTYSGYDDIGNIDLAPVQPSTSESNPVELIPFTQDENAYSQDSYYPGDLALAAEPVILRDIRAVQISMYPAQYNPVRRTLRIYRDLSVSVSYDGDIINPKTTHRPYLSDGFYPIYKEMFSNFEELFGTMEVKRGGYMFICKPALVDSLKTLAFWKHQKGYTTRIVPTTEINPGGSPTYTQIYNFIRTAYQTWETRPEYVMLVGDIDGTYAVADYPYQSYPSDHHYACVDGTDFLPDLFIGRMSVDNMAEARRAFSKPIKYEKTPLMLDSERYIRGLAVGYPYYDSARLSPLWARQLALRHGFSSVDTIFGTSHNANLATIINRAPGLIWYRGAAGSDGWWGPDYTINDLNAMPLNQKLNIWVPITCGLCDIGTECFGEIFIRMGMNPDSLKGGPAFYSSSDHNSHTKWNNPIIMGFFYGLFEENAYHMGAAALASKMQLYRTFPRNINSEVQVYFNTYITLGDPETEIRTKIPILIDVDCPDTIAFGLNHIEINVTDTAGNPIPDAFVTLIKGIDSTEEVFGQTKTDLGGNASIIFAAETPGEMKLTVSGQDLYPFVGSVQLIMSDIAVGFESLSISDDSLGYSSGNGDSLANPNETLELYVTLKNFGTTQTANNLVARLTPLNEELVTIFEPVLNFGDLAPGESRANAHPYVIHINRNAQDADLIRLKETVTDQNNHSWNSAIEIPVKAPKFNINRIAVQDGNNRLDPGDSVSIILSLVNRGQSDAAGVSASIISDDDHLHIVNANGTFGAIPIGDTSLSTPFIVMLDAGAFPGRRISFTLNTATSFGSISSIPFSVPVDSVVRTDPTGPDEYGYYIYDKTDTSYTPHPTYNWVEISPGLGGYGSRIDFGSRTDDNSVLITLPFDFVYYGQTYRSLIVCTNGFVSPDTDRVDMGGHFWSNFDNWQIPDQGNIRGQICPFWDDLRVAASGNYGAFTWHDTTQHDFVIEWNHTTHSQTSAIETFEMIIHDPAYHPTMTGDAEILFQYIIVNNTDTQDNYATVGIESWDQQTGIQYTYDNSYGPGATTLTNNLAILITTNTGRGGVRGHVDLANGGHNENVMVETSTGQHRTTGQSGDYWIKDILPGTVNISASTNGYFSGQISGIQVSPDRSTPDINFNLIQCPVPSALVASDEIPNQIEIAWASVIHPEFRGYNLYRSLWRDGGYIKLNGALLSTTYFVDRVFPDTGVFWYYATAVYSQGDWQMESFASQKDDGRFIGPVGINDNVAPIPGSFFLSQNYPNPFNPTTTISYGLAKDSDVKVEIFNLLGQRVATLMDKHQKAGYRSIVWDGKDGTGKAVSSGIYLYRIEAGSFIDFKKMLMLK